MKTLPERIDEIMAPFEPLVNGIRGSKDDIPLLVKPSSYSDMFDTMKILLVQHMAELYDEIHHAENKGYLKGVERTVRALKAKQSDPAF